MQVQDTSQHFEYSNTNGVFGCPCCGSVIDIEVQVYNAYSHPRFPIGRSSKVKASLRPLAEVSRLLFTQMQVISSHDWSKRDFLKRHQGDMTGCIPIAGCRSAPSGAACIESNLVAMLCELP